MNRRNSCKILLSSLSLLLSFQMLFAFFPALPIYGFTHEIPFGNGPDRITITSNSLFIVLKDSYYPSGLKLAYIFFFAFQIISVLSTLLLFIGLLTTIIKKRLAFLILLSPLLIAEIFSLFLFREFFPMPLLVWIICFASTVLITVMLSSQKGEPIN